MSINIKLEKNHICDDYCTLKNGICGKAGKIEDTSIYISSFNNEKKSILNKNEIVIDDEQIKICFDYPLNKKWFFDFSSQNGFTREQLIKCIVDKYYEIYQEEETTSKPNNSKETKKETKEEVKEETKEETKEDKKSDEESDEESSEESDEDSDKNEKKERFSFNNSSKESIEQLLLKMLSALSNGPFMLNRQTTNGKYGIWGHAIEDLVIEELRYDKNTKIVSMFIGS